VAIYHLSVKAISRSAGRSATAAAAYRAGEWIQDERTGQQHDYRRKRGIESAEIVLPSGCAWHPERAQLWNAAEAAERRKDGCVAREYEVALPAELSAGERRALARAFAQEIADRYHVATDVCIHEPGRGGDARNHHAHILTTTRQVDGQGLGDKAEIERSGRSRKADLAATRALWAEMVNAALERAGHEARIDHRTIEAQGLDREPTRHMGPTATALERRGEQSRKRQDWTAEATERLARARLEYRAQEVDRAILDTTGDLTAARAERAQREAEQYAKVIASGLSPVVRRAVIRHGVHVRDQTDGTHWLTVHESDGIARGIAHGGADQRHLADRVAAALPAAVRQIEAERVAEQAEKAHRERERATSESREQEQTGRGKKHAQQESRREPPPTQDELDAAREALSEYARRQRVTLDTPDDIRAVTTGLRDEWVAAGTGTQRRYMALRQIRREAERAARERLQRTRRDGTTSEDSIRGGGCTRGYCSAELAALRAAGLHYEWDASARCRRYLDRDGHQVFTATRTSIAILRAEDRDLAAALSVAAAKWGGRVSIQGSAEFRERAARQAVRAGIEVADDDLREIVESERGRMARGESPGGAEWERPGAAIEADDEQDQDLGR
jgi:hypothetical protein